MPGNFYFMMTGDMLNVDMQFGCLYSKEFTLDKLKFGRLHHQHAAET
jgi:hypothetical protein